MVAVQLVSAPRRRVVYAIVFAAALLLPNRCSGDATELRLRLTWGGGEAVAWKGRIGLDHASSADGGQIKAVTPIGIEPDSAHAFQVEYDAAAKVTGIRIDCPTARVHEAVDLQIQGIASGNLNITMSDGSENKPTIVTVPISKLVAGHHVQPIDDRGNRLTIERVPGDRLRIDIQREHLVFAPGEAWTFKVMPHKLGTSFSNSATLQTRLLPARTVNQLWLREQPLTVDESGAVETPALVSISVPHEEGVYDVELTIVRPRQRAFLSSSEVVVQRRVQFVVISESEPESHDRGWRVSAEYEFDPAQPKLFPRLVNVGPRNGLGSGLAPVLPKALGSRDIDIVRRNERTWTKLATDGWQAYPLSLGQPGEPHILEIDYPGDAIQSLGVSLVEPNSLGGAVTQSVDGMIHVEEPTTKDQRYRLIFWPNTKQPYLVFTNRHSSNPAMYGAFRVYRRDGRLPAVSIDQSIVGPTELRRFAVARFSRSDFSNHGYSDIAGEQTERAVDDWKTFYDGVRQQIEYARYLGYDAVSIEAIREGSAIFPAPNLLLSPKYDTGVYASTGQDPVRKDVLEMMFRLCDRNGIKLIPAIEFTAIFQSLEQRKHEVGIRMRLANGAQTYNPTDPIVQSALIGFVEQIASRYGHHPSFGGLGITMVPGAPTHLPTASSASDAKTVARFLQEAGLPKQRDHDGVQEHLRTLTDSSYQELWLRWRADQIWSMYQSMARAIRKSGGDNVNLYLTFDNLIDEPTFSQLLAPRLPFDNSFSKALLSLGLNFDAETNEENLVLLRPRRIDHLAPIASQGPQQQFSQAANHSGQRRLRSSRASNLHLERNPLKLDELDAESPFGTQGVTRISPRAIPAGPACRQPIIQSLAAHDARVWFDGGWTAVRDQHDWLAPIIDVYRRLPDGPFQTCDTRTRLGNRLVVRKLPRDGVTYVYIVNNSPWRFEARLQLNMPTVGELKAITPYKTPGTLDVGSDGVWWECTLQPYDLIAGVLTSSDVDIVRVAEELPEDVTPSLRNEIIDLSARIAFLARPRELTLSRNPSFESPATEMETLPGWLTTQDPDVRVQLDSLAHHGKKSLRVTNGAPVAWLRSKQFTMSDTGRLLFRVWARTEQAPAPRLRLLAESTTPGVAFTRQADLALQPSTKDSWRPYDLWIDDVPLTVRNLRIGIDVLGPGIVWLDDAQAFDLTFSRRERNELSKMVALADLQLREGRIGDCRTSLDQYWLQYVKFHVSPNDARIARASKRPSDKGSRPTYDANTTVRKTKAVDSTKAPPHKSNDSPTEATPRTTSALERLRRLVPGIRR